MTSAKNKNNLTGKVALVLGASRGIGQAVAKLLALAGAEVMAVGRNLGGLTELDDEVRQITNHQQHIIIITADISDNAMTEKLFMNIKNRFGHIDILVGAAAMLGPLTPLYHLEEKDLLKVLNLNLIAYHRLIRYGEPLLKASKNGRVVFFTSSVAQNPPAHFGSYSISKAGLEAMMKTWASELKNSNITINAIDPLRTRTHMRAEAFQGEDPTILKTPDKVANFTLPFLMDDNKVSGEVIVYKEQKPVKKEKRRKK